MASGASAMAPAAPAHGAEKFLGRALLEDVAAGARLQGA